MREKLKKLIQKSQLISDKKRQEYLYLVELLDETQLIELAKILTKEDQEVDNLILKNEEKKSKINKKYLKKLEKQEQKISTSSASVPQKEKIAQSLTK